MKTWMSRQIELYGIPPREIPSDAKHKDLLGWATMTMIKNYFMKMKMEIVDGKVPQNTKYTWMTQIASFEDLKLFLMNKVTVPLLRAEDDKYVSDDDFENITKSEFLFTFFVGRGDTILDKKVSVIPKDIAKVVSGALRNELQQGHAYSRQQELRAGKNKKRLSDRAAFRASIGQCNWCDRSDNTSRCSKCKAVFYCCKEHQKLDWKWHKVHCLLNSEAAHDKNADDLLRDNDITDDEAQMSFAEAQMQTISLKEAFGPPDRIDDGTEAIMMQFRR